MQAQDHRGMKERRKNIPSQTCWASLRSAQPTLCQCVAKPNMSTLCQCVGWAERSEAQHVWNEVTRLRIFLQSDSSEITQQII